MRCSTLALSCPVTYSDSGCSIRLTYQLQSKVQSTSTERYLLCLQVTPGPTMRDLFFPSLVSMLVPLLCMTWRTPELQGQVSQTQHGQPSSSSSRALGSGSSSSMDSVSGPSIGSSSEGGGCGPNMLQLQTYFRVGDVTTASMELPAAEAAGEPEQEGLPSRPASNRGSLVLYVGIGSLVTVPLFKYLTGCLLTWACSLGLRCCGW